MFHDIYNVNILRFFGSVLPIRFISMRIFDGVGVFVFFRFVRGIAAPGRPAEDIHPQKNIQKPDTERNPEPFDRPIKEKVTRK